MELCKVEKYVGTLDPELQRIYRMADGLTNSLPDTLEDNFQIAAEIVRVFQDRSSRGEPMEQPSISMREAEWRRSFWQEFSRYAIDDSQSARFKMYGDLLFEVPDRAREQLNKLRGQAATELPIKAPNE